MSVCFLFWLLFTLNNSLLVTCMVAISATVDDLLESTFFFKMEQPLLNCTCTRYPVSSWFSSVKRERNHSSGRSTYGGGARGPPPPPYFRTKTKAHRADALRYFVCQNYFQEFNPLTSKCGSATGKKPLTFPLSTHNHHYFLHPTKCSPG